MALQKNIKLADNFGIEVEIPNAYIKIPKVECSKESSIYFIEIKKNKETNSSLQTSVKNFGFDLSSSENPIKQAYLHLKTLPEFSDATDY